MNRFFDFEMMDETRLILLDDYSGIMFQMLNDFWSFALNNYKMQ